MLENSALVPPQQARGSLGAAAPSEAASDRRIQKTAEGLS